MFFPSLGEISHSYHLTIVELQKQTDAISKAKRKRILIMRRRLCLFLVIAYEIKGIKRLHFCSALVKVSSSNLKIYLKSIYFTMWS